MSYQEFDRQIPPAIAKKMREQQLATERRIDMQSRWIESERILGLLRQISARPEPVNQGRMTSWFNGVDRHTFRSPENVDSPSIYFSTRFRDQAKRFGPPFLEELQGNIIPGASATCVPIVLNSDFFGGCLGGEAALGHKVIYYPSEDTFYFFDPKLEAFFPVSEAKMQLLASNYLLMAAQACSRKVNSRVLIEDFRKPSVLREITTKAKSLLEAAKSFFVGPNGYVRYIDGRRVDPTEEPAHRQFVQEVIASLPGAAMTISDMSLRYTEFCRLEGLPALTPPEFKRVVPDLIVEFFNVRLRHDIPDLNGRHQHGWMGLSFVDSE